LTDLEIDFDVDHLYDCNSIHDVQGDTAAATKEDATVG
jgi:hypothetical protein